MVCARLRGGFGNCSRAFLEVEQVLAPPSRRLAADEPQGSALRRDSLGEQPSFNPSERAGFDVAQLDQRGRHTDRREADANVRPPLVADGISDEHLPQFDAPLPETLLLSVAICTNESTGQRSGCDSSLGWEAQAQEGDARLRLGAAVLSCRRGETQRTQVLGTLAVRSFPCVSFTAAALRARCERRRGPPRFSVPS